MFSKASGRKCLESGAEALRWKTARRAEDRRVASCCGDCYASESNGGVTGCLDLREHGARSECGQRKADTNLKSHGSQRGWEGEWVLEDNPRTDDSPLRHESVDSVREHSVDVGRLSPCGAPVEATAELQDLMEDAGPTRVGSYSDVTRTVAIIWVGWKEHRYA